MAQTEISFLDSDKTLRTYSEGKIKIIYSWAAWCVDCRRSVAKTSAYLQELSAKSEYEIYSVCLDETKEAAQNYAKVNNLPFPAFFQGRGNGGEGSLTEFLEVFSIPALTVLDGRTKKQSVYHSSEELKTALSGEGSSV